MKNYALFSIVAGVMVALAGCATTLPEAKPPIVDRHPIFGVETATGVGQSIYSYSIQPPPTADIVLGQIVTIENETKEEILFSGFSQGTLRATYREFVNDMARPAFSQEATYDFTPGTPSTISFKGAQIEVLDANNNEIRYRVLRGFDGEQSEVAP